MWQVGRRLAAEWLQPRVVSASGLSQAGFHLNAPDQSRIKHRFTHKPYWHIKKTNKVPDEPLTPANQAFLLEVARQSFAPARPVPHVDSPLKPDLSPWSRGEWQRGTTRCGLLGRKIGIQPLWYSHGKRVMATLIQIEDNHVIRYVNPEEAGRSETALRRSAPYIWRKDKSVHLGTLVVGALSADPSKFTKDYCGLFTASGLMPKKKLARFPVTENAIIQPGTPLFASHFDIGQFVDVRGRSRRKGFHGVMKRWGFAGMPSDERGVTKSHRRPGHIGSGAKKARVWPGQKMPGHVGGNSSVTRGLKILRINHEHNVLYIQGQSIPGEPGEMVQIFDCRTNGKDHVESPKYFPTCYPEEFDKLPEEEYSEVMHRFEDPTIMFQSEETSKKGKK